MSTNIGQNATSNKPAGAPRFPDDNYQMRIKEEPEFKVSKKGNDMLVFKLEVVEPATGIVDGEQVEFAGWEFTTWAAFFKDEAGNEQNPTLANIHQQLGYPLEFDRDETSGLPVGMTYTGQLVWVNARSEKEPIVSEVTGKQRVNPLNGQPEFRYNRRVVSVLKA